MNSSTSSSKAIYLKLLLTILVGMGVAMGIIRGITYANNVSTENFLGRVLEAQDALPQIVQEEQDLVMVYGSSMVQAGFSPREFDAAITARGGDIKSFNFGFGGLNPFYQDMLARRIREAFDANNRRLKLAVIEFNPFQTTVTRYQGAVAIEDSFLTVLGSDEELFEVFLDDPERGMRLYEIRYLRGGISAEMNATFFGGELFSAPRPRTEIEPDEENNALRGELGEKLNAGFEADYPDFDGSNWYYPWQGGGTILSERSEDLHEVFEQWYTTNLSADRMDNDRLFRVHSADIEQLNFEPILVEAFIRIVKTFQAFSDQVEVVLLPKNTEWIKNPPEAIARQQAVLEQISAATGVQIRDYQVTDRVKNSMFSDTTHLNRYQGATAFTNLLVDEFDDDLIASSR